MSTNKIAYLKSLLLIEKFKKMANQIINAQQTRLARLEEERKSNEHLTTDHVAFKSPLLSNLKKAGYFCKSSTKKMK